MARYLNDPFDGLDSYLPPVEECSDYKPRTPRRKYKTVAEIRAEEARVTAQRAAIVEAEDDEDEDENYTPRSPQPVADLRGQLMTPQDVALYVRAGNATVTLQSLKTGNRFTFKVSKPKDSNGPALFFVKVLTGRDNTSDYQYLGMVANNQAGERFVSTKASRISRDSLSFKAFEYFWRAIVVQQRHEDSWGMSVYHEGTCGRCGRKLTVPRSIANGIGPECEKHMGL